MYSIYNTIFSNKLTLLFLILLSSFGPYVFPSYGVRLEHITIYFILLFLLLNNKIVLKKNVNVMILLTFLSLLVVIPFFGYVLSDKVISNTLAMSQLENYIQPLSIVLITLSALHNLDYHTIKLYLHYILKVFVILMALHTFVSILMKLYPGFDFWRFFTGTRVINELSWETTMNAAELAAHGGRSSGVFTQVFEAGYAYSLALIFWAYLQNTYGGFIKYRRVILLLIFIGGIITYSKVFLVFGLVFFSLTIKKIFLIKYFMFGFVIIFTAFIFDINMGVFEKGLVYIKRLIFMSPDVSMFDIYTSGRFADDSIIVTNMKDIVLHSPVFGYGYGSIKSSDFSLYEVLSLGGLVGVISYLLLFLYLSYLCFSIRDVKIKELYVYVLVITISTSLSAPTITANRINVIFWIIISMAVLLNITQSFLMIDKRTITNNR